MALLLCVAGAAPFLFACRADARVNTPVASPTVTVEKTEEVKPEVRATDMSTGATAVDDHSTTTKTYGDGDPWPARVMAAALGATAVSIAVGVWWVVLKMREVRFKRMIQQRVE